MNPNNIALNIKRSYSEGSVTGEKVPNTTKNETASSDSIIRQFPSKINDGIVNNEGIQKSEKDTGVSAHDIMDTFNKGDSDINYDFPDGGVDTNIIPPK